MIDSFQQKLSWPYQTFHHLWEKTLFSYEPTQGREWRQHTTGLGLHACHQSHFSPSWMILGQLQGLSAYVGSVRSRSVMVTLSCTQAHARVIYIYIYIHTYICRLCVPSPFSHVLLVVTPWTVAHQAPLSMGFSRQEHRTGLPCPPPGNLLYIRQRERERERNTRIQWMDPGQIQSLTYKWSPECLLTPHLPLSPGCSAFQLRWKFLRKSLDAFLEHGDLAGLWKTIFRAPNMGYISKLLVHSLFISKLGMTCVLLTFLLRKNAPVFIIYLINLWAIKK